MTSNSSGAVPAFIPNAVPGSEGVDDDNDGARAEASPEAVAEEKAVVDNLDDPEVEEAIENLRTEGGAGEG